jgi:signal transduction histidine kinase
MNWQTVLVIVLLLLSTCVGVGLAVFAWRRREFPGAGAFVLLTAALAEWSLTYALEISASGLADKILWAKFQYIGISLIPVGWFLFVQSFTGRDHWNRFPRVIVFLIVPVITMVLVFTNEAHGLIWKQVQLDANGPLQVLNATIYGVWWWIFLFYSYGLLFWGSYDLVLMQRNAAPTFRWQSVALLVAVLIPWIANGLYLLHLSPIKQLDLGPFAFAISALVLGLGMYRYQLFDLKPLQRPGMIDRLDVVAFVLDTHDRVIDLNQPAIELMQENHQADPFGKPVAQALWFWSIVENSLAIETQQDITLHSNGLRRYYTLQIAPLWNASQHLTGRLIMLRDITADRLASEAMALAQVKTEFLAKVSHELRSPLTSILGVTEMLDYGVYGPLSETQHEGVKLIFESTQHMIQLVNDLLQQARIERGTFRLDITEFVLADLVERVRKRVEKMAQAMGLSLNIEVSSDMPETICSDPLRLYQILTNLADNAIKYTHSGAIWIRILLKDRAHFAMQVSDTGVGIPKEMQRLIFHPFKQAHSDTEHYENGFGLGLSIVKQLTSLMGGEVSLVSEVGQGSTFTVVLPIEPAWECGT